MFRLHLYFYTAQKNLREAREFIEKVPCKEFDDEKESELWEYLMEKCLSPVEAAFVQSQELKEKLGELRNTSLTVLVVVNILWLTFMLTVMNQGKKLEVFGTDFASVGFLFIYFLVRRLNYIFLLKVLIYSLTYKLALF